MNIDLGVEGAAMMGGEGSARCAPLPGLVSGKNGQKKELVGQEEFHGGKDSSSGLVALADVEGPTTLRDPVEPLLNSLCNSRAEGVKGDGNLGMGQAAISIEVPARGAEDHGIASDELDHSRVEQGSGEELTSFVQKSVSPSSFRQVMSLARSKLCEIGTERMQNTVEEPPSMTDDFFPLPLPLQPGTNSGLACADMVYGLNMLACGRGEGPPPKRQPCGVVENLGRICERFKAWEETFDPLDFKDFFAKRGVTYDGEEVRVAQTLTWEGVRRSLPDEVGRLELRDFCTQGTLHYLDHFEDHLIDTTNLPCPRAPRVMVGDDWPAICEGLINKNICEVMPIDQLYHIDQVPLLNGMFGVGKGEFEGNIETQRLIMNLVPLNRLCEPLVGDVVTLPNISSFGSFLLDDGEVALISSEDVRCFFYLFRVPSAWKRFLGFNRRVPPTLVPEEWRDRPCVLTACVLPMGFINSVSIAQHVHRNIVIWSQQGSSSWGGSSEMRKDRVSSVAKHQYRVYLDNFDLVERYDPATAEVLVGKVAQAVQDLREQYAAQGIPRHPKKAVVRAPVAEIQGAIIDGAAGFAQPKAGKVTLYCRLALMLVKQGSCTLKELQVVCGGFVYFTMFRRPLLCILNEVWRFMEKLKSLPPVVRLPVPVGVQRELLTFILLTPLAQIDFRCPFMEHVTSSDASTSGGGMCVSEGLTGYGVAALHTESRGDLPHEGETLQVLTVGLFDGLGALRLAVDSLGVGVAGHLSVEKEETGRRVVEAFFPDTIFHDDVKTVDHELVRGLAMRFPSVSMVLLGAGPPCQGVSGLNASKKGALRDARSSLYQEVPRIKELFKVHFPWAQVRLLMESVASMSEEDRAIMSEAIEVQPYRVDAGGISLCHRPRLYWVDWDLTEGEGVAVTPPVEEGQPWSGCGTVELKANVEEQAFLEQGWFVTFTTSRPREQPGFRPAGLDRCAPHEKLRWEADSFRFPPYQYRDHNLLWTRKGAARRPNVQEREAIMCIPVGYTRPCLPKSQQSGSSWEDTRLSLIGNSWHVGVVTWLLEQLLGPLGFCRRQGLQQIVDYLTPGRSGTLQGILLRPPLLSNRTLLESLEKPLLMKLLGLVSMKGEDLMVTAVSEPQVKFHRLRSSVPARLWRWREVTGWRWRHSGEHINVLELRAILTTLRWLVTRRGGYSRRFLHLTDSLVCLHSLSRGRSSSRKLRHVLMRVNSLILAADLHPIWGYVHTAQNSADRPSRRPLQRKWGK